VALDVYSSMRGGYFVELGASDGLTYSNTVDLERHYGWRGLCIEGAPHKFAKLQANRPLCANRYAAVTADDTTVVHEIRAKGSGSSVFKRAEGSAEGGGRNSTSMRTLLRGANAPTWIDFLSLDVEGFSLTFWRRGRGTNTSSARSRWSTTGRRRNARPSKTCCASTGTSKCMPMTAPLAVSTCPLAATRAARAWTTGSYTPPFTCATTPQRRRAPASHR
jgi:hypothetical protein